MVIYWLGSLQVYETQVREPGGTFHERLLHSGEASTASHGITGSGRRKDDVTLPLEGGWRWDGDWEVDSSWTPSGMWFFEVLALASF